MTLLKTAAFAAALAATTALVPTIAVAQRNAPATAAPVVVVANIDQAVQQTNAFTVALQQIQVTYAPQITNLQTRAQALQTELQPLLAAAQAEAARQPRNQPAYEAAVRAYQTRQQAAEAEVGQLEAPIRLAQAYAQEQITLRASEAITAARTARRADIVLTDGAVIQFADGASITAAITTELNRLVPNVQIVPPAGYQPGALMRAAQQQAAAAAPAAPVPAAPQTR
jgi:Skp family chaperone for outer membrane proteins